MSSLAAESIVNVGGFPITNTLIATAIVDILLLALTYQIATNVSIRPGRIQAAVEPAIEGFYSLTQQIAGKYTSSIFPWFMTFFLFIFANNMLGLMPGFGSVGFFETHEGHKELVPLLRAATSDFNTTLGLATVSIFATHILSIKYNGFREYIQRFISLNPIYLFVGLLELISEGTKLFSLSFRLFGNIYAGEVVLATISGLFAFVAPIPFLLLETIVALVQALVFAMLTMVFMSILVTPHSEGGEH